MARDKIFYTDEEKEKLFTEICDVVATSEKGLGVLIKENPRWPRSRETIYEWRRNDKKFDDMWRTAKAHQVEVLIDEIIEIADDKSNDNLIDRHGNEHCNKEWVSRSRLRIDTRKWVACKLVPRLYGDKIFHDSNDININANLNLEELRKEAEKKASDFIEDILKARKESKDG